LLRSLSRGSPGQKTWLQADSKNLLVARTPEVSETMFRLTNDVKSVRPISITLLHELLLKSYKKKVNSTCSGDLPKIQNFIDDLTAEKKKGKFLKIFHV
jgi:hypothetical protein